MASTFKFKYGTMVTVIRPGFYEGVVGMVIRYDEAQPNYYEVELGAGHMIWLDETDLELL